MLTRDEIIKDYIDAYNRFDIESMTLHFDASIHFENVSDGVVNMVLDGLPAFKQQAEMAKHLFSQRAQVITALKHGDNETEASITYTGTLAADFPNGLKKGDTLQLSGKSVFTFANGKITRLVDMS